MKAAIILLWIVCGCFAGNLWYYRVKCKAADKFAQALIEIMGYETWQEWAEHENLSDIEERAVLRYCIFLCETVKSKINEIAGD